MTIRSLGALLALALLTACGGGGGGGAQPEPTTGTITGRVTDTAGQPVAGATVRVGALATTTGPTGEYTLSDVPAGAQTLTVTAPGGTSQRVVTVPAGGMVTGDLTVPTPVANRPPTVQLTADPPALLFVGGAVTLTVTATDPDGDRLTVSAALDGATVALTAAGEGAWTATVNLPGNLTPSPLTHTVTVTAGDGELSATAEATVTVAGIVTPPTDPIGGVNDPGGGPPIPEL